MSGVIAEKLYPPTIASSIPAFYVENGTATLAVPFSMNRAVDSDSVGGFKLKIKTVQSNSYIQTLSINTDAEAQLAINKRIAYFTWQAQNNGHTTVDFNKIKLGQYLKVQLAYVDRNGNVGYFSTVAMTKYTSKPNVSIQGLQADSNTIPAFRQSCVGIYQTTEDTSERPYSYCFYLYNAAKGLEETSEWKLHNTSLNRLVTEAIALDQTVDTYSFTASLKTNEIYYIQYGVRTINNLEVFSPLYPVYNAETAAPELQAQIVPKNNFDNAFIEIHLKVPKLEGHYPNWPKEDGKIISIEIARASKENNYNNWQILKQTYFSNYEAVDNWSFKDFTVEQGVNYIYSYRQYGENVVSERVMSDVIVADFEDIFLWDGNKQLKIKYNPKISSFKNTLMEQKIETIGSKFPFIFKNGIVSYKEFPIAGLLSYLSDNEELFLDWETDLNLIISEEPIREKNPYNFNEESEENISNFKSTSSFESQNIYSERIFKLKALEWLNNGKIKMFKSPTEGNYFVRLMNVSMTPEDRIGRMLHTIQMTAYEIEEMSYANMLNLNFIRTDPEPNSVPVPVSVYIKSFFTSEMNFSNSILLNEYGIWNSLLIDMSRNTGAPLRNIFYVRIGEDSVNNKVLINTNFNLAADGAQLPNIYFNPQDNKELLPDQLITDTNLKALVGDAVLTYYCLQEGQMVGDFYGIDNIVVRNRVETWPGPYSASYGSLSVVDPSHTTKSTVMKFWAMEFVKKTCKTRLVKSDGHYYYVDNSNGNNLITDIRIKTFDPLQLYQVKEGNIVKIYYVKRTDHTTLIEASTISNSDFWTQTQINSMYNSNSNTGIKFDQTVKLTCDREKTISEQILYEQEYNNIIATIPAGTERNEAINKLNSQYPPYTITFSTPPIINLYEAIAYNKIQFGWGIYLKVAYQERTVSYI